MHPLTVNYQVFRYNLVALIITKQTERVDVSANSYAWPYIHCIRNQIIARFARVTSLRLSGIRRLQLLSTPELGFVLAINDTHD